MKTGVISEEFRKRYLSNPKDPNAFEGRAIVFDGPEDYHKRIDDPALKIDELACCSCAAPARSAIPGAAEVVNMRPPSYLIKKGVDGAGLHRRRPPVRHLGLAVDPERLAGGGDRRRARHRQDRRPRAHRSQQAHGRHPHLQGGVRQAARRRCRATAATSIRRTRRPGRRSSAASSTSSPTAWC